MDDKANFDFRYAVDNTHILLAPASRLETFGATVLNYHLVTELLDEVNKIRVREGRVKANRPEIVTPNSFMENLLDGFGEQAQAYAQWLRENDQSLMILRYGFAISKEQTNEEIVTGELPGVAERVRAVVEEKADPLAAVVVGVEQPWEVCLLKLMVDVVQNSAQGNVQDFRSKGITSEADLGQLALKQELETDFASAAANPQKLDYLCDKLKKSGLFEQYEDRFFALVRRHRPS